MKWQGRRGSSNVEDRRGGGGGGGKLVGGGIGGIILVVVVTLLSGGNVGDILGNLTSGGTTTSNAPYQETAEEQELAQFVSVVLADTEDVWSELFAQQGMTYTDPTLVLYSGSVNSACGTASSAVGPFYCPGDSKLYIDLSFYDELQQRFKAPGDFAMAYVIAHEVGHHVQTLLGTTKQLDSLRRSLSETEYNKYQVRFELQADYLAGVWANHAQGMNLLEEGDLEEALTAASAVGDDTIQKQAQGYAVPDSFTHGTSEQRKRWFYKGFNNGTITGGDTFNAAEL
ncbi:MULTISPECIES: neutral zinc metallopeptidase [unclassified Paenibacillus]|uniref:KPN_02809 family neutral zinc metallopeptidase n=1 Tax=unclassified Paenibacillus TaxID=185978 RepID=UPI002405ECE1|nr:MULTISPECIES: neutral zinc metallopeptidase [unclassified Paenibacillus]MDF9844020.1 putative metalloprotease [Paenibacillus sp. PastF-2]MDF9850625.1 putative metalloprotease [Paenibacillus sp. PastM-2]MDF9857225.1 putative metalloprotease [Paenibacillus sp. PastF-1]MDH6482475.1 putative metalloprotease [Paenibacillus sp. PastH-2]MDH6509922.1 putative metalloprotease [Paenibacillus sp. PastM-3]